MPVLELILLVTVNRVDQVVREVVVEVQLVVDQVAVCGQAATAAALPGCVGCGPGPGSVGPVTVFVVGDGGGTSIMDPPCLTYRCTAGAFLANLQSSSTNNCFASGRASGA